MLGGLLEAAFFNWRLTVEDRRQHYAKARAPCLSTLSENLKYVMGDQVEARNEGLRNEMALSHYVRKTGMSSDPSYQLASC